jgi:hypothetical protein
MDEEPSRDPVIGPGAGLHRELCGAQGHAERYRWGERFMLDLYAFNEINSFVL